MSTNLPFGRASVAAVAGVVTAASVVIASIPVGAKSPASADPVFAVSAVLSGLPADFSTSQSVVYALESMKTSDVIDDYVVTTVADSAAADAVMADHASQGFGLIVAEGPFADAVTAAASRAPDRAFVLIPDVAPRDAPTAPNVSLLTAEATQGANVLGEIAAVVGAGGPISILGTPGDSLSGQFAAGFTNGAAAANATVGAPVATVTEAMGGTPAVIASAVPLTQEDAAALGGGSMLLFGNAVDLTEAAPGRVVASQVYHWENPLSAIIAGLAAGDLGGDGYRLTLANGGLTVTFGAGFAVSEDVQRVAATAFDRIVEAERASTTVTDDNDNDNDNDNGDNGGDDGSGDTNPSSDGASGGGVPPEDTSPSNPEPPRPTAPATDPPPVSECQGMGVGTANDWRAAVGAGALSSAGLGSCSWAREMAATGNFAHGGAPEVIAMSSEGCSDAWSLWRNSPGHYQIITDPAYTVGDFSCAIAANGDAYMVGRLG